MMNALRNLLTHLHDSLIADDPAPEYSRLDRLDGLGRTDTSSDPAASTH